MTEASFVPSLFVTTQPHVISKPKAEKSPYLLGKSKVEGISPFGRYTELYLRRHVILNERSE